MALKMFRELSSDEEKAFRQHSRDTFDPSTDVVNPVWHPVSRDECNKMITEYLNEQVALLPSVEEILQVKGE